MFKTVASFDAAETPAGLSQSAEVFLILFIDYGIDEIIARASAAHAASAAAFSGSILADEI